MKPISFLLIALLTALPGLSEAAFLTCEDAENYGWNTSTLFATSVYLRADCDPDLLQEYEIPLARIGSKPLTTSDTDEIKVCYFAGFYRGLMESVSNAYEICAAKQDIEKSVYCPIEPQELFSCIPFRTVALFAANVLIGVSLSVDELTVSDIQKIFDIEIDYAVCKQRLPGLCAASIISVLNDNPEFDDYELAEILAGYICQ